MRHIYGEYEFSPEQLNTVRRLAENLSLTLTTAKILYSRGIDTEEKARRFLSPSSENFISPLAMKGMAEAVALLKRAKEEEWSVAVFGDYDADGIGASAIMYRALCAFGIEPYLYVPERTEGYGMTIAAIDKIFDECCPDLFLTVDCGISNKNEVAYIEEQGAYVIVTDHHELPDELPDCICINPKIKDDYPYDNLCGAGVAFKLATALIGERAYSLLDFAALSTVADSVPLTGENRDIVSEGLKRIQTNPRPAFKALLGKQSADVTAQTLAFTVAPRLNAAGRMGDAGAALALFTSDDESEILSLATKLNVYNMERQKYCDELYSEVRERVRRKGSYGRVIMLSGDDWNAGFIGIVAARIAEEFSRPALLFVRHGDMLKGSARSVENVNIFEALKDCSEYIEEFGGHAQAAGVNVKAENFDLLEAALDEFFSAHYKKEDFIKKYYVGEEMNGPFSGRLARELNSLEPYGVGNRRPLFSMRTERMSARPIKEGSTHVAANVNGLDLMYFGGIKRLPLLESDVQKTLVFECNLSKFKGKESVKGIIRYIEYDGMSGKRVESEIFDNNLTALISENPIAKVKELTEADIHRLAAEKLKESDFGTLFISSDRETLKDFPELIELGTDLFRLSQDSLSNALLVSPMADTDVGGYRDIVYLDCPFEVRLKGAEGKNIFVNADRKGKSVFHRLSTDRKDLVAVFSEMRRNASKVAGRTPIEAALKSGALGFGYGEFLFAFRVFSELGFFKLTENGIVFSDRRADLADSAIYRAVSLLVGGGRE